MSFCLEFEKKDLLLHPSSLKDVRVRFPPWVQKSPLDQLILRGFCFIGYNGSSSNLGSREKLGGVRFLLVLNFILFMQKS